MAQKKTGNDMNKILPLFLFSFFILPFNSYAFVPDLGHLIRQQPSLLKANPVPFVIDGSIDIEGERAPFKLTWSGTKDGYTVEFKKIPASWVTSNVSELILYRDGAACLLTINKAPYPCSSLRFWGDFEFNVSVDRVIQNLSSLGIANSSDMVFRSVTSKDYDPAKRTSKVKPVVKTVQGTFMSVLEFTNGNNFIDFDSTTFAPLMARFAVDGMNWDFIGDPDFFLEKEENRNNLIVSRKIEVREGDKTIAVVKRDPLKRVAKATLPNLPSTHATVSDVPYDRFSEKGRNFLKVLFLTH